MRQGEQGADKTQHWCDVHQTNWFKRGKMRNFAHPIEDTKEWCNEPSTKAEGSPGRDELQVTSAHPSGLTASADNPNPGIAHICAIPGHNSAKLVRSRQTGVWGHILEDGTPCLGVIPEMPTGDRESEDGVGPDISDDVTPSAGSYPEFPDTPLGTLQREVDQEEMEWANFEKEVIKMPWPDWIRIGGNVLGARARWKHYKQQQIRQQEA